MPCTKLSKTKYCTFAYMYTHMYSCTYISMSTHGYVLFLCTHMYTHILCFKPEGARRAEAPCGGAQRSRLVLTAVSIISPCEGQNLCYHSFSMCRNRGWVKLNGPCNVISVVVTGFEPQYARDPPFLSLLPCPKQLHAQYCYTSHSEYPNILAPRYPWLLVLTLKTILHRTS